MKTKSLILGLFLIGACLLGVTTIVQKVEAQPLLLNDTPDIDGAPIPDDYQFDVLGFDHTVVGIKPVNVDNFDIEVYTDTTFTTLIESSTSMGNTVDFVVLDKTMWGSPPSRGIRVTSGATSYVMEMENDVDDYTGADTWSGAIDPFPGNPVLERGPPGSWDDVAIDRGNIYHDGSIYHMWYAATDGSRYRIGYATSPDGITWTRYPGNLCLGTTGDGCVLTNGTSGSWDALRTRTPTVFYDGITYHMWYSGMAGGWYRIGYATSPDGITWTKNPNYVLSYGSSGSWDSWGVSYPMVIHDGVTYHMWYAGTDGVRTRIGYATSLDGITWTRYSGNLCSGTSGDGCVFNLGPPDSWDDDTVYIPTVLYNTTTSTYKMWYTGSDGINYRGGYATSPDGITWTKYAGNLCVGTIGDGCVMDVGPPGSWDNYRLAVSFVYHDGVIYQMWFGGTDGSKGTEVGYATSPDGINWTKFASTEVLDAYQITGILSGVPYAITLDVPTTVDLDLFIFNTTGGRDDAFAFSTNTGAGINESISFIAPTTGDYMLVITNENNGTGTYTISLFDNPPLITVFEPGGTSGQTYTQGDQIVVTWNASDDKPLPTNPINITYGNLTIGWSTIAVNEANDGKYNWDTTGVPCPGSYWMNLSVYDLIGQTAFDIGNFSFNISCPDFPPTIETWEPGGTQYQNYTQGEIITVRWFAIDDNQLPPNPINITYGNITVGWTTITTHEQNDGFYDWDTTDVFCPGTYWMNLSVYDSIGQTDFDEGNYSFNILCPDLPPIIEAWEPGGTPGQIYTQGDTITVNWNASDDKPLPLDPINITYGVSGIWTPISTDEANDRLYSWDTSDVPCPGSYWMNLSVYDSNGQTTFDEGNYSFELVCPVTYPPIIDDVKEDPDPQTIREGVTISAEVTDVDTDIEDLLVYINITKPDGTTLGNFTMNYDSAADRFFFTSIFTIEGNYSFTIWACDLDNNWDSAESLFVMKPEIKLQEYNWKPIIALIFTILLLLFGILGSYHRPIKLTGILRRDRIYTFLGYIFPFVIAEIITGILSLFIELLHVPPILGVGLITDLIILITGIIICLVILRKGAIPKSYEEVAQPLPPPPPPPPPPPLM